MDSNDIWLDNSAFSLLQAIKSINNIEAFSLHVIPGDIVAANDFMYSLHHIQAQLEGWFSVHIIPSPEQSELLWRLDALEHSVMSQMNPDEMHNTATITPATSVVDSEICQFIASGVQNTATATPLTPTETSPEAFANATSISNASPTVSTGFKMLGVLDGGSFQGAGPLQISGPGNAAPLRNQDGISRLPPVQATELIMLNTSKPLAEDSLFIHEYSNFKGIHLSHLAEIVTHEDFTNIIKIRNLPTVTWDTVFIACQQIIKNRQHSVLCWEHQHSHEYPHLTLLPVINSDVFQPPCNDIANEKQPDDSGSNFLESLMEATLAQGPILYFIGRPLDDRWNHLVDTCDLLQAQVTCHIEGLASPCWRLGAKFSGTAFHKQDGDLRSMNLVLYGFSVWLIIDTQDTCRFEEWFYRLHCFKQQIFDSVLCVLGPEMWY
ncbi:hypothetical protein MKX08_001125 [Trichoderma sp. CBMAI-0020]|nr:hypothetical protein MKX08_001125 [Trichoderma sp. CBMAI-0020]